MIDRSFIEKIEEMTGPKVIETDYGTFSDIQLHKIEDRLVDTTKLSSLSGLVTMMKQEMNNYDNPLFVRVVSPDQVDVLGTVRCDMQRERPYVTYAKFNRFDFDSYMSIENMIINLKSRFAPTEDRDYLVQLLGNITDQQSVQTKDDGITQSATVKSGIQLVGEQRIKPIVSLKPYRTFLDCVAHSPRRICGRAPSRSSTRSSRCAHSPAAARLSSRISRTRRGEREVRSSP